MPVQPLTFRRCNTAQSRQTKQIELQRMSAPAVTVRSDHGVFFITETVLQVCSVYPNTVAASLSCAVRAVHFVDAEAGCGSLPDVLSHDA